MIKLALGTGVPVLNSQFNNVQNKIQIVDTIEQREDLVGRISAIKDICDVVLITDMIPGKTNLMPIIVKLRQAAPNVRIVYLTKIDMENEARIQSIGVLIQLGVYDIIEHPKDIMKALLVPADYDSVASYDRLYNRYEAESEKKIEKVEIKKEEGAQNHKKVSHVYDNLFTFSSIKPGTGKSFVSANIATLIAKYGVTADGKQPKVALIDADLQNLSLGTLLQYPDNEKHNLKTVFDKIATVFDKKMKIIDDEALLRDVNNFIKESFLPYSHAKNLRALVGSQITAEEFGTVKRDYFNYLLSVICSEYDVVIVDSNSSLGHVSTFPLLHLSNKCYYILNLDFNNIRNNARYRETLNKSYNIPQEKIKYILNENITESYMQKGSAHEELRYNADSVEASGFDLSGAVPIVEKSVFLNHIFDGTPIALDDQMYTLEARVELAKIANQIMTIEKLPYMEEQFEKMIGKGDGSKKKRKGFLK